MEQVCTRYREGDLSYISKNNKVGLLGSNDPNTIPDPTRIRCSRSRIVFYVSARTPLCFGLRYVLCFLRTLYFPVTFSRDFVDICFMSPFHYSLCFPRAHYVSLFHFLRLRSFPSTLSYCSRLDYSHWGQGPKYPLGTW